MAKGGERGKSNKRKISVPRASSSASNIKPRQVKVAIIGGGIAGLYCGYKLLKEENDFLIAEATSHIGGKILSTRILQNGKIVPDGETVVENAQHDFTYVDAKNKKKIPVEFCAEFGPMRIELDLQKYLQDLLGKLGLLKDKEKFPPYGSPPSERGPYYMLTGEEFDQSTPFDLLKLAVIRILGKLRRRSKTAKPNAKDYDDRNRECLDLKVDELISKLSGAIATRQTGWKDFDEWVETLGERDYQNIRQYGIFGDGKGMPLWKMGFWNLLSEVLSHPAVMKLRDLGTFYHLIPENPNAAEWLIFWLRAFKTSQELVGIRGGMQRITEAMAKKIGPKRILKNYKLVGIEPNGSRIKLTFDDNNGNPVAEWSAEHVILALPTAAMKELVKQSGKTFYQGFDDDLGAVFGFPLLKFFFTVKKRWWDEDEARTNRYATMIPTRELHYRRSSLTNSRKGIIMVYTDRPALTFWSNYIKDGPPSRIQRYPEIGVPADNRPLINKALTYLKEYGVKKEPDINFYGIRDWGREPYVGAAHAWFPGQKLKEVLKRLSSFRISPGNKRYNPDDDLKNVHVCGEAYSDYQAFIEGALRSSEHVLHTIMPKTFRFTPTPWLCGKKCIYPSHNNEFKRLQGHKKPCYNT